MELGAFSVSLAVKDIEASKLFYEKLGFTIFAGDQSQNWLIMKNGDHAIGLFQGMFDENILTFNPGWSSDAQQLREFTDVRELQRQLKDRGVNMISIHCDVRLHRGFHAQTNKNNTASERNTV